MFIEHSVLWLELGLVPYFMEVEFYFYLKVSKQVLLLCIVLSAPPFVECDFEH